MWKATCLAFDVSQFVYRSLDEEQTMTEETKTMMEETQKWASTQAQYDYQYKVGNSPLGATLQSYPDWNKETISTWLFPTSFLRRNLSILLKNVWTSDFDEVEFRNTNSFLLKKEWFRILFDYVVKTGEKWRTTRIFVDNPAKSFVRDRLGNRLWAQTDTKILLYIEVVCFQANTIRTMRKDDEKIRNLPNHIRIQYEDYFVLFSSRRLLGRYEDLKNIKKIIGVLVDSSQFTLEEETSGRYLSDFVETEDQDKLNTKELLDLYEQL
jgi:hypothetical protein